MTRVGTAGRKYYLARVPLYKPAEYRTIGGGRLGMHPRQCNVRRRKSAIAARSAALSRYMRAYLFRGAIERNLPLSNDVFSRVYSRATAAWLADTTLRCAYLCAQVRAPVSLLRVPSTRIKVTGPVGICPQDSRIRSVNVFVRRVTDTLTSGDSV